MMNDHPPNKPGRCSCQEIFHVDTKLKKELEEVIRSILSSCLDKNLITHIERVVIPSKESIVELLSDLEDLLFPGYFGKQELDRESLPYHIGSEVHSIFEKLSSQITRSIRQRCGRNPDFCEDCTNKGQRIALDFLRNIPRLRSLLADDVNAHFDGDPASQSYDEIVFSYPGMKAITIYRIAHELFTAEVPLIPRIMTECAHSSTGIDIHPGADIGRSFFIDHGTGVVVGETTVIGNNVRVYQGVTLGALSFPVDDQGNIMRGKKRHPTIEDDVTIYSGATILGGETVIGKGAVVGGNLWVTSSVPPGVKVIMSSPKPIFKEKENNRGGTISENRNNDDEEKNG
jgi:serine O-acetyltransferase